MRPSKRDDNEREIILALRIVGAKVQQLDGTGIPDLLVAYSGQLFLLEVKDPSKANGQASKRSSSKWPELTPAQVRWWSAWDAKCMPVIVRSPNDALAAVGAPVRMKHGQ